MGLLQLGALSALLSESLISGFTTGAAFHVITTQVPHVFGLKVEKFTGPGRLLKVRLGLYIETRPLFLVFAIGDLI